MSKTNLLALALAFGVLGARPALAGGGNPPYEGWRGAREARVCPPPGWREAPACPVTEIVLPASFFADAGGVGGFPDMDDGGGGGGGFALAGASAGAHAFASARVSVGVRIQGGSRGGRGCGCK
ncbi:MAG: hypothetical protein ACYC8V_12130 [Caulobacteraceae bacterium]